MEFDFKSILDYSVRLEASDIYVSEWKPITFRVNWELKRLQTEITVDIEKIKEFLLFLLNNDEEILNNFYNKLDIDFTYLYEWKANFRINAFYSIWKIWLVLRRISSEAVSIEKLNFPSWVMKFTKLKDGLILVTWPTWAWKSTSMVSILEEINKTRKEHIITIEDPIEFIFKDNLSTFSQRELWEDTRNMENALKAVVREDPNVVMVWELRDRETVSAALELAWTWHLVISTLHTSSASQTLSRLISFFPPDLQPWIKDKLADVIWWILCQRLIIKADKTSRVWIFELMLPTSAIRNLIRSWEFSKIKSEIETWRQKWMILMKDYADILASKWIIKEQDYINYFIEDSSL